MKKYIIGGGITGLIESYYNDCLVIDKNFLGQLNMRFIPGVRLFKESDAVRAFIIRIFSDLNEQVTIGQEKIKVGYHYDDWSLKPEASIKFKEAYSLKTRGKKEYEDSFLSSGENLYYAITVNNLDCNETYKFVFDKLLQLLKKKNLLIEDKIESVMVNSNDIIGSSNTVYHYDELISTINLNILLKLLRTLDYRQQLYADELVNELILLPKSFYKLPYQQSIYSYIYSIAAETTRVSYFKDYRVAETNGESLDEIMMKDVLDKYEKAPLQIKTSLKLDTLFGIKLSGRYAQWDHSIKANQTIEKYEQ